MPDEFDAIAKIIAAGGTPALVLLIYSLWRLEKRLSRLETQVTIFLALIAGSYENADAKIKSIARIASGDT